MRTFRRTHEPVPLMGDEAWSARPVQYGQGRASPGTQASAGTSLATIKKRSAGNVDDRNIPPFMRQAWRNKNLDREFRKLREQTIDRPILGRSMPPGGTIPRQRHS
jgi:hypothetical protein